MTTDQTSMEMTIAQLAKKIDDQARFTRSVSIICTLTILGVMFYMLTEMFSNLPAIIILHYMGNLEKIVYEWNLIQNSIAKKQQKGLNLNPAQRGQDTTKESTKDPVFLPPAREAK